MANAVKEAAIKKLKLVITVVDRAKAEFYLDVLSQYEVNCQLSVSGLGTARSERLRTMPTCQAGNTMHRIYPQRDAVSFFFSSSLCASPRNAFHNFVTEDQKQHNKRY